MQRYLLERALKLMATNDEFTMGTVFLNSPNGIPECGTPACIAGHIIAAARPDQRVSKDPLMLTEHAAAIAHLTDEDRQSLFVPLDSPSCDYSFDAEPGSPLHITREHAVRCLRKFIDTGLVDWNGTAPDGGCDG